MDKKPHKAIGWILADSRYRLFVNGKRIQWGPAPSDPRWQEADPIDLTAFLTEGKNVIAVEVCFFGSARIYTKPRHGSRKVGDRRLMGLFSC